MKKLGGTLFPALAGCYSQGETVDEALENIKEAILLCLEDLQAENQPIPDMSKTLTTALSLYPTTNLSNQGCSASYCATPI